MTIEVPPGWVEIGPIRSVGLPTLADEARAAAVIVAIADGVKGLGAGAPAERGRAYGAFLFPYDTPASRAGMIRVYSCALTDAGILVRAGFSHRLIDGPYAGRQDAVTRLVTIGRETGTLLEGHALLDWEPEASDMAIVGTGPAEHAMTFTGDEGTIEGGQTDPGGGYQILAKKRHVVTIAGVPHVLGPTEGVGRPLMYVIRARKLPFDQPAIVPQSFAEAG